MSIVCVWLVFDIFFLRKSSVVIWVLFPCLLVLVIVSHPAHPYFVTSTIEAIRSMSHCLTGELTCDEEYIGETLRTFGER